MKNKIVSDYAIHPGVTLLETIEALNISQTELAERTGRPKKTINEIIHGKAMITAETAIQFERVLGVPATFWLQLESNYQEAKARVEEAKRLSKHIDWIKSFPYKQLVQYGWIKEAKDPVALVEELLAFFGVASVAAWESQWNRLAIMYRKSPAFECSPFSLAAWLRRGELEAQNIECTQYNRRTFLAVLQEIRALTKQSPKRFIPQLVSLCSECGVAIVFVKELSHCPISGATRWLSGEKALIQMSLRYKTDDHFWFTFFHESCHVLKHRRLNALFIDSENMSESLEEIEANEFARDFLIDPNAWEELLSSVKPTRINSSLVKYFAQQQGISPGIVVGRLQHEKVIPYNYLRELKRTYEWTEWEAR